MLKALINGVEVILTPEEEAAHLASIPPTDPNAAIDAQILALEATVTQRRLREAALTTAGKTWLAGVNAQIAALRAQRVLTEEEAAAAAREAVDNILVQNREKEISDDVDSALASASDTVSAIEDASTREVLENIVTVLKGDA